ncbi:hypothetical protein Sste5346_009826 [Sporothrix stenoceras]|uniref:Zn(2)-C6 fungal-type domain-containing protein n=1 Tax=Sporothrix stenoceras TaxID=5173 RepID=A0ABR3YIQ0_9PEZI
MERTRAARSAKWGEACAPCASAKTRCIRNREEPGASCDRCQSLGKDCFGQVQKPRKKRQARPSRTAQLEERLNNLIQAMSSSGSARSDIAAAAAILSASSTTGTSGTTGTTGTTATTVSDTTNTSQRQSSPPSSPSSPEPDHDDTGFGLPQRFGAPPISPHCTCRVPVSRADLVPVESDEVLLNIFINQLSAKFPFVIVPPGTTVQQMIDTRPFLMKVIRMVSSVRYLRSMWGQSRAVIKHISEAMLVRSERSMDLLQGIIVFLGFYHYFCMSHAHFNNLAHLALSLVGDMGLSAPPRPANHREGAEGTAGGQSRIVPRHARQVVTHTSDEAPAQRTNEERRALLGVWYINSNAGSIVKQLGGTRYTKYIDQCVNELEQAAEYKSDQLVVELIRVQNLAETIFHFHNRDQLLDDLPGVPRLSPIVYLEALQAELDRLRAALPQHLRSNPLLTCHYNSARLSLFVPLLAEECYLADASLGPMDLFTRFTEALKTWFADWLTIPVCSYFYLPQSASSMLVHASRHLVQWARLAGPSAVRLSSTAANCCPLLASTASLSSGSTPSTPSRSSPSSEPYVPRPRFPTFMGIPSCPTLDVPKRPTAVSDAVTVAAQDTIDMLRAAIYAEPDLRLDILGIAAALVARFESAKVEITAAQGGVWKNDTWDAAGDQLRMKRFKIEEWVESATAAGVDENVPLNFGPPPGEQPVSDINNINNSTTNNNWKWPTDLADGGANLDFGTLLDSNNDWNTDWNAQGMSLDG